MLYANTGLSAIVPVLAMETVKKVQLVQLFLMLILLVMLPQLMRVYVVEPQKSNKLSPSLIDYVLINWPFFDDSAEMREISHVPVIDSYQFTQFPPEL